MVARTRAIDSVFPVFIGRKLLRERRSTQDYGAKKSCNLFRGFSYRPGYKLQTSKSFSVHFQRKRLLSCRNGYCFSLVVDYEVGFFGQLNSRTVVR